jgi:hypothetical protein
MNPFLQKLWCALRGFHRGDEPILRESGPLFSLKLICKDCGEGHQEHYWRPVVFNARVCWYKAHGWKF